MDEQVAFRLLYLLVHELDFFIPGTIIMVALGIAAYIYGLYGGVYAIIALIPLCIITIKILIRYFDFKGKLAEQYKKTKNI